MHNLSFACLSTGFSCLVICTMILSAVGNTIAVGITKKVCATFWMHPTIVLAANDPSLCFSFLSKYLNDLATEKEWLISCLSKMILVDYLRHLVYCLFFEGTIIVA